MTNVAFMNLNAMIVKTFVLENPPGTSKPEKNTFKPSSQIIQQLYEIKLCRHQLIKSQHEFSSIETNLNVLKFKICRIKCKKKD